MNENKQENTLIKKDSAFTIVPNAIILDKELSAQAKGVAAYLFSRPNGWKFYESEISNNFSNGRDSIRSALKELKERGFLETRRERGEKGVLGGSIYTLYNTPIDKSELIDTRQPNYWKPYIGSTNIGSANIGESDTNNTNNSNTDNNNTDKNNKPPLSPKGDTPNGDGLSGFTAFWKAYPRKVGISVAKKIWHKREKDLLEQLPKILSYISQQIATNEWQPNDPVRKKYIPHPSTFLNQNRWEDLNTSSLMEEEQSLFDEPKSKESFMTLSSIDVSISNTRYTHINELMGVDRCTQRTASEWEALWNKHYPSQKALPVSPLLLKDD